MRGDNSYFDPLPHIKHNDGPKLKIWQTPLWDIHDSLSGHVHTNQHTTHNGQKCIKCWLQRKTQRYRDLWFEKHEVYDLYNVPDE